ncbi:hypothetical protein [Panacagrimonas sp.]|uniref:hypothetical protein n=1 Tax=Panacagrimonas sp. TaxID=2480088 RepID=UPI003B516858
MRLNPQIVGNLGLYWCCYKLSLLGWNAMPTARNARGVDIIAYSSDASRFKGIQVKALSKRNPVPLGKDLEKCMGDFWVIINKVASESPSAFILTPDEVKSSAHRGEKDGKVSYWLQPSSYEKPEFKEAWGRIGHGGLDAQPLAPPDVPAAASRRQGRG